MSKVIEIGIEGLNAIFLDRWTEELPTFSAMRREGIWGAMRSTVPPVPVVSWTSAQTGRNPGVLGFWDETQRDGFSYSAGKIVRSTGLKVKSLYALLPLRDKKVATIGLPLTSPPPRVPGGYVISERAGTDPEASFTWPKTLKAEVGELIGEAIFDVYPPAFDGESIDRASVLRMIRHMDRQRFQLLRHFITRKQCDYVVALIPGFDRMARGFYRFLDPDHRKYVTHPEYAQALKEHCVFIDKELAELRGTAGDNTVFFVHSTFGVQRLEGRINLNEWLIREGYMVLGRVTPEPSLLRDLNIDWSRTKAWSLGENGALYLNVKGKEPEGIVEPSACAALLDELVGRLSEIRDDKGEPLEPLFFRREDIHRGSLAQYGPDLFVIFNEGHWGTSEKVGSKSLYDSNFTSPQGDVVNSLSGFFALAGPGVPSMAEEMQGVSVLDVAPTVLSIMKEPVPDDFEGRSMIETVKKREQTVRDRLAFLGY